MQSGMVTQLKMVEIITSFAAREVSLFAMDANIMQLLATGIALNATRLSLMSDTSMKVVIKRMIKKPTIG